MIRTTEIDIRALLDGLEEPPAAAPDTTDAAEEFDGVCTSTVMKP